MGIPATFYFSCCSVINVTFLVLGFNALDEEKPNFSPLLVLLLKQSLAIFVCHSSSYALIHRPGANTSLIDHFKVSILGFSLPLYVYIVSGPIPLIHLLSYDVLARASFFLFKTPSSFGLYVDFLIRSIVFSYSFRAQRDKFFPIFVLIVSFFTAAIAAMFDGLSSDPKGSKMSKKVELAASILASIIFQILVKFTSFSHVVAFLCFCVVWLGCLALVMPRSDLGVFDLLVCNVLVACVKGFGLYGPTLFAYCAASVVLFVLHMKLKTVRMVHDHDIVFVVMVDCLVRCIITDTRMAFFCHPQFRRPQSIADVFFWKLFHVLTNVSILCFAKTTLNTNFDNGKGLMVQIMPYQLYIS